MTASSPSPASRGRTAALLVALAGALLAPRARAAADIEFVSPPTRADLDDLVSDLGCSLAFPIPAPAEGLGTGRVEIGVSATASRIDPDRRYWRLVSEGEERDSWFGQGRASVRVGLPAGIDLGVARGAYPGTNVELTEGEVKWAFLKGGNVKPALAARVAYMRLSGVDQLDLDAASLELAISKGFAFATPYASVGRAWLDAQAHDLPADPGFRLSSSPGLNRVVGGLRLTGGWFQVTVEGQRAGGLSTWSLKLALKFP